MVFPPPMITVPKREEKPPGSQLKADRLWVQNRKEAGDQESLGSFDGGTQRQARPTEMHETAWDDRVPHLHEQNGLCFHEREAHPRARSPNS